jgi:hypothetical protein
MRVLIFAQCKAFSPSLFGWQQRKRRRLREHQKGQITYPFFGYYLMLASEYTERRLKKQPGKKRSHQENSPIAYTYI